MEILKQFIVIISALIFVTTTGCNNSEAEKERVSTELKSEVADLSLEISQKVASSMTKKDQQKLIDKFIKDMG